jgi:hypothetical protein
MFEPTMTAEEAEIRQIEANVRLTEAKAEGEAVKARKMQFELDKSCGELVYLATALNEFNEKLAPIMAVFRSLPQRLAAELKLKPDAHARVQSICDDIARELADISFDFDTAAEVDQRASEAHRSGAREAKKAGKPGKAKK